MKMTKADLLERFKAHQARLGEPMAKDKKSDNKIFVYDAIGRDMFGQGVSAQDFADRLAEVEAAGHKTAELHINSPGGFAYDGIAIYNLASRSKLKIDVYIDGMAASAAGVIAMAGDRVVMAPEAEMMVHNAWSLVVGNASDLREEADQLDRLDGSLVAIYSRKTGLDEAEVKRLMSETTFMKAEQAVALGFADEAEGASGPRAMVASTSAPSAPAAPSVSLETSPAKAAPKPLALKDEIDLMRTKANSRKNA